MSGTVTIEVPAPQPEIRRPDGDPGGADSLAQALYATAGRYEEFADAGEGLRDLSGWWGSAYTAYQEAAGTASGEHVSLARTVKRVANAVTAYADTLRDLLRTYDELRDRRTALDGDRADLIADINATTDATPSDISALQARAAYLAERYQALVADHDSWLRQVTANEDLLRHTFESATGLGDALSEFGGLSDLAQSAICKVGSPMSGASPEQVAAWWEGLTDAEREAVIAAYPDVIGSADGLPASVRDDANRVSLDGDLARLGAKEDDGTIDSSERDALDNARKTEEALADADAFTDPITGERPGGQLWLYDPGAFDGDGRVAVAIGDLDTADDVAVFTPGISTDMGDVVSYANDMQHLYEATRYNGDGSSVATMFWLGYDTPSGPIDWATLTEGRAEDGGRRLADAFDGLRASRGDDPAHLTAIGHSYGSTTTSYAAGSFDLDAEDVVLIGSPGAGPSDEASDFSVGQDHVYVGRDSRDFVAFLGDEGWVGKFGIGLGTDPSSGDFDATRFEAERPGRGATPIDGGAHSSYLAHDSESLYNISLIVDGHGDQVNESAQSYDPWYGEPEDPEWTRDPSSGVPGRSETREP